MTSTAQAIGDRVQRMKRAAIERDGNMLTIQMIRSNKPEILFPKLFSETWKKSIVANAIDTFAREFSEMIAPLPALNCSSGAMKTDADKARAQKKNVIGGHYWHESKLPMFMVSWADGYLSYGFAAIRVEADYEASMPRLRLEDGRGLYYENDRFGTTLRAAKCFSETVSKVSAMFPDLAPLINTKIDNFGARQVCAPDEVIEVVQYDDVDMSIMFIPARQNLVLTQYANVLDYCAVQVAERPGLLSEPTGQFDQIVWVQLAKQRMAMLGLEAGVKAVGAPLAVPRDVVELAVGPDSVIQTDSPEKVRRVGIEVPQSTFALGETLEKEMRTGGRYPEGRATGMDASVITGRGIQALMGSFDTQISTAQTVLGGLLARVTSMAFELDAKVWPSKSKRIQGTSSGESYDITYVPSKAIGTSFACDVSYGFAAGLAPNAALVMMLQARGDGLIDRDTVRRNMPWAIDSDQMQRNLDIEQTADALKQGFFGLLQTMGPMAAQGQDPRPILRSAADIIKGRRNGKDLADLFVEAFAPEVMADPKAQQAQDPNAPVDPNAPAPPPGAPAPPGADQQVTPGQAQMGPGGMPDLQTLMAGMRNGQPQLNASVTRKMPTS